MSQLAWWVPSVVAAVVAAGVVLLLARPRREAEPPVLSRPSTQPGARGLLLGMLLAALIGWASQSVVIALAALALWLGARAALRSRQQRRLAEEEEQHAIEAIGIASRSLRAGIPLGGMLQMLANEGRGQTGQALREVIQRESMGETLASAIRRVLLASPLASLRAFGLALTVQLSAGGNLAQTTDRLAMSLVERGRVRRRARTILAYSRAAASVLTIAPLVAVPLLSSMIDGYSAILLDRPEGNLMLGAAAIMLITGLLSIQRISRIDTLSGRGGA